MFVSDVIFNIPAINNWFGSLVTNSRGWIVYLVIWLVMFLQVTVLNMPAYVILSASISVGISVISYTYVLVVMSAYMCGCSLAYFIGYKYGKKAVVWCAGSEDDYNKWSLVLNEKGKFWYFLTVLFPVFPDDILCIVAGAMKFDLKFYLLSNFVGRTIGLMTSLISLELLHNVSGDFPFTILLWGIALVIEIIVYFVLRYKKGENDMNILLIGSNTEKIAKDIWSANTNYYIIGDNPDIWSDEFINFSKDKKLIVLIENDRILSKKVNDVIDDMFKYKYIPIIVTDFEDTIDYNIYSALSESIPETILYIRNDDDKEYNEFIKLTQDYLLGKGIISDEYNTLRTSKKGKRSSLKK